MSRRDELVTIDQPPGDNNPSRLKPYLHPTGWIDRLIRPWTAPQDHAEIFPITLIVTSSGFFPDFRRTAPINSTLLIHYISVASQGTDSSAGSAQFRFALGNTLPSSANEFNLLEPLFPEISQGTGDNRGFWVGARSDNMIWPVHKIIRPRGKSIVVQYRSVGAFPLGLFVHILVSQP